MKIALIEPFFSGSHRTWAEGLQQFSKHQITIFSLPGRHWKWRMFGGAVALAQQFLETNEQFDLILASDMLDLATFLGLIRKKGASIPTAIYFHENQITYPWSPNDQVAPADRNNQYGFINFTSALAADAVFFNSDFHQRSFLESLPTFLKQFPDRRQLNTVEKIAQKSQMLPLGMNLKSLRIDAPPVRKGSPVLLWNHRWEYDKNPEFFFQVLFRLKSEGHPFRLVVLGESYPKTPPIFEAARTQMKDEILQFGFAKNKAEYARWLHMADILPVSSQQDFFGGSVVEAIFCNCYPILPNRLAFPGHIPKQLRETHLYRDTEEFYTKIRAAMQNIDSIRTQSFRDFVARYDWSKLAAFYDESFQNLML